MTKVDYKRELGGLYRAGVDPAIVDVPELCFLMVDGQGDPNASAYREAVEALYAIAYAVKFAAKRELGQDFGVMPLESLWWAADMAAFGTGDRSAWMWTAMIVQPDVVTADVVEEARETVAAKRQLDAIERVHFERFTEGLSAQILHVGPYAAEAPTIARLHAFMARHGYETAGRHHEIYLGDPRRAAPDRLRTIIRQPIAAVAAV